MREDKIKTGWVPTIEAMDKDFEKGSAANMTEITKIRRHSLDGSPRPLHNSVARLA